MKKALSLLIAAGMLLSLAACGSSTSAPADSGSGSGSTAPAASSGSSSAPSSTAGGTAGSTKAYPNCNDDGSINLDTIANFDHEYDYTQNEKIKFAYLALSADAMYQQSDPAFSHWCNQFNMEYVGFVSANNDTDMYFTELENLIDQGVTCLALSPDGSTWPTVVKIMSQHPEVSWMPMLDTPRTQINGDGIPYGGYITAPSVGFDQYQTGVQQVEKLIEWKDANIPDADWSEIGLISIDFSPSPPLHARVVAEQDTWNEYLGNTDNLYIADCVSSGFTIQAGMDVVGPIISSHSEYKYWLIAGQSDDWSQGAAAILEQQGLTENSCIVDMGGYSLRMQWDGGQYDAFRYSLFLDNTLYAEPVIGAAYAFAMGWATPDTIWPSWVNQNDCGDEGHTYPTMLLPTFWLDQDSYQHYLEWVDLYANSDVYGYSTDGVSIDDFSPYAEVPASYAKQ